jgi:hypothetical protein
MEESSNMPIIGMTDKAASFPQIGVLRKGAPKPQTGNKPGADLQYFRFDTDDTRAADMFATAYGKEPTEINIYFAYQTPEENFQAWKEEYSKSSLIHRCDGQNAVLWLDTKTNKYSQVPKPCPGNCKPTGRLFVIVPELQRFAYVVVGTTSIHDIMRITQNLEALYAMRGDLRGIPFVLRRTPEMISTPNTDGSRARREKWLLSIEALPEWVALQLQSTRQQALGRPSPLMLTVNAETGEIVTDDEDVEDAPVTPVTPTIPTNGNGNGHKPEPAKSLPFERASGVDTHLNAIEWGMEQSVFEARQHAENSYKKLSGELNYVGRTATAAQTDALLWAWVAKVEEKVKEQQAAPQTPEPVDALDADGHLWAKNGDPVAA